mgnify:CR=1 FL=1
MAGYIKIEADRVATTALNTKVNKEVFDKFKVCCKVQGYPLNVMLEVFMQQYASGRFDLDEDEILRWKGDTEEADTLNTTFNKEIYTNFKYKCKGNGYFVKHVVMAFMERYANSDLVLEYREK